MGVPAAILRYLAPGGAFAPQGSSAIAVYLGCSSKGPLMTPTPFGARQYSAPIGTFGCGPMPKESAYPSAKVAKEFVCIRLPKVSVSAFKSPLDVTGLASNSTATPSLAGTPLDGYDARLEVTAGGTLGTTGISTRYSLDGGLTWTSPAALGTALSVVLTGTGLTLTLGTSSQSLHTGDVIAWYTLPASAALLPLTYTRADASTGTITPSGSPEDGYEVDLEIETGGTAGVAGMVVRYSLDGGNVWSKSTQLNTSTTLVLQDGSESSGITLTFSGDFDAGDAARFTTTPPAWQWSDASTALDTLRNSSNLKWSFLAFTGYARQPAAASAGSKLEGWAAGTRFSWAALSARDRGTYESDAAWSARLLAEYVPAQADIRTMVFAGSARVTCPITGRRNRRSSCAAVIARLIGYPEQIDPGEKDLGPLSSDVAIHDPDTGALDEHDARVNSSLHDANFATLRTWEAEEGLEPGVFPTGGPVMGPAGDIQRITYTRVLNLASYAYQQAMQLQLVKSFRVWPSTVRAPWVADNVREDDARAIEQAIRLRLEKATAGKVSAISVILNRTPVSLGSGKWKLLCDVKITGLEYIDNFEGTIGFTDPALDALLNKAA